ASTAPPSPSSPTSDVLPLALASGLVALERRLGRGKLGDRHAIGRAGDIVQSHIGAEMDRGRIAAVLAADAELQVGARLAATLRSDLHQLADAFDVEADERILFDDTLPLIGLQEATGVVAAEAVGGLG